MNIPKMIVLKIVLNVTIFKKSKNHAAYASATKLRKIELEWVANPPCAPQTHFTVLTTQPKQQPKSLNRTGVGRKSTLCATNTFYSPNHNRNVSEETRKNTNDVLAPWCEM